MRNRCRISNGVLGSRRPRVFLAVTVTSSKAWIEVSIVGVDISDGSVAEGRAENSRGFSSFSGPCSPWAQYPEETPGKPQPDVELTGSPKLRMEKPSRSENSSLK
ncbi:hypothetical protein VNO77_19846 [Canavalia gladiata]|uniref:Uncharacterized protein n=1 Tax=Canavalia gladiata TaxID=3824 RepID=A0AAN9LS22_CANGL